MMLHRLLRAPTRARVLRWNGSSSSSSINNDRPRASQSWTYESSWRRTQPRQATRNRPQQQQQQKQPQQQRPQQQFAPPLYQQPPLAPRHGRPQPPHSPPQHRQQYHRHSPPTTSTLGEYLQQNNPHKFKIPTSPWLLIDNIPKIYTFDPVWTSLHKVLESRPTLVDLDAPWRGGAVPVWNVPNNNNNDNDGNKKKYIQQARLVLGPFGRPRGWFVQLQDRSLVYNILCAHSETESRVKVNWKHVRVRPMECDEQGNPVYNDPNMIVRHDVSDHTVRMENAPLAQDRVFINWLSRYDLQVQRPIEVWKGVSSDGRQGKLTYLIHFKDASWARAAMREKQGQCIEKLQFRSSTPVELAQYPKQFI